MTATSIRILTENAEAGKRTAAAVKQKANELKRRGHAVTIDLTIGGLFRIDGGPELTVNQFLSLSV